MGDGTTEAQGMYCNIAPEDGNGKGNGNVGRHLRQTYEQLRSIAGDPWMEQGAWTRMRHGGLDREAGDADGGIGSLDEGGRGLKAN